MIEYAATGCHLRCLYSWSRSQDISVVMYLSEVSILPVLFMPAAAIYIDCVVGSCDVCA